MSEIILLNMSNTPTELHKIVMILAGNADANPNDLKDVSKWEKVFRMVGQLAGHSFPESKIVHSVEVSEVENAAIINQYAYQVREVSIYMLAGQSDETINMIIKAGEGVKKMIGDVR